MDNDNKVSNENDLSYSRTAILEDLYEEKQHEEKQAVKKQLLPMDTADLIMAMLCLVMGIFAACVLSTWDTEIYRMRMIIFTIAYLAMILIYGYSKNKALSWESWFWAVITLCIGISWTLNESMMPIAQFLGYFVAATYCGLCSMGGLTQKGRTSQWVVVDALNALLVLPFSNIGCQGRVLVGGLRKTDQGKKAGGVLLGICLVIPILLYILPQLSAADRKFGELIENMFLHREFSSGLWAFRIIVGTLISLLLFGLLYGCVYRRHIDSFANSSLVRSIDKFHIIPDMAVYTVLIIVGICYLVFMVLQGSYLFSAFIGILPKEFTVAEYAREGFFELCQIAAFNGCLLLAADAMSVTVRKDNRLLKLLNIIMAVLTIAMVCTAMSKMFLYIESFGLTPKRVVTTGFMIWMLITFGSLIVYQRIRIPITRISVLCGAVIFCILSLFPIFYQFSV